MQLPLLLTQIVKQMRKSYWDFMAEGIRKSKIGREEYQSNNELVKQIKTLEKRIEELESNVQNKV